MTEQEQIELVKSWIKQYSLVIVMGVCIAILAIFGWQSFQKHQNKTLYHASIIYDKMLAMRSQNHAEAAAMQANRLFTRYPKTTYGQMAALMLARDAVIKKDYPGAEKKLIWVIENSKVKSFQQVAKTRLARLYLADKKPALALQQLKKINDATFAGLINEIRGDAYLAMNQPNEARAAYQKALSELPNAEVIRPLLQMKYDNLATMETTK
jgi:predicted negative regulator of RcsB-dependent stress response